MSSTAIFINIVVLFGLAASLVKDRARTAQALRAALRSGLSLAPTLLGILVAIGVLLGFVPEETIARLVGEGSGATGMLTAGLVGAVLHIPALVSFPLAGSLMEAGASVTVVAGSSPRSRWWAL